ncbi:hypothetical protein PM3016_2300 [Paenibacillus mucilaginosus 3016]|uniref:HEAT repeat domain-containing protein n=1 Tax=Paenibacillus mucilaginosus 3016 TaxID=1116391 RepID=H6NJA9_9BACL|nr:hypothetical protein [Paenibacillus mucilaginosus]AFC29188.1 hypothetical protein PM3016_2300 [Paenibacillus mucilaginosus 3016]WFA17922.1 hypothetical protein ERY13_11865 [Paenibacillus mucilaginosus]
MDASIRTWLAELESADKNVQYEALQNLLAATDTKVDWAYEMWGPLLGWLTDRDNHRRSRAAQLLSNLARSDPDQRMLADFSKLWAVTYDPKFVTARHTLQNIWKVGLAGPEQKSMVVTHLADRFRTCSDEKNYTLVRYDIIAGLKKMYDERNEEEIKRTALSLIDSEEDLKYRKKYAAVWS